MSFSLASFSPVTHFHFFWQFFPVVRILCCFCSQSIQGEAEAERDGEEGQQACCLQNLQAPDKGCQECADQDPTCGRQTINSSLVLINELECRRLSVSGFGVGAGCVGCAFNSLSLSLSLPLSLPLSLSPPLSLSVSLSLPPLSSSLSLSPTLSLSLTLSPLFFFIGYVLFYPFVKVLPLKPDVGQYIAIHDTLTASDFFLVYFYPSSPFT